MKLDKNTLIYEKSIHLWILLVILILAIFSVSGWFILQNQDRVNIEMVRAIDKAKALSTDGTKIAVNPEIQLKELDELNDSISEEEFSDSELDDNTLGL